jgi:hypothetical protein
MDRLTNRLTDILASEPVRGCRGPSVATMKQTEQDPTTPATAPATTIAPPRPPAPTDRVARALAWATLTVQLLALAVNSTTALLMHEGYRETIERHTCLAASGAAFAATPLEAAERVRASCGWVAT